MSAELRQSLRKFPVTFYFLQFLIIVPLFSSLAGTKYIFRYAYDPFILEYRQFWRLLTFQVAFINESEVLLSALIIFKLRLLERHYSSNKYFSLIAIIFFYNLVLASSFIPFKFYTNIRLFNEFSSGPFTIIFALLSHFKEHIPTTYKFEVYGTGNNKLVLTDNFFLYIISFQLLISQGIKSIYSSLLGWILGILISRRFLPGKDWRFPFLKKLTQSRSLLRRTPLLTISRRTSPSSNTPDENEQDEDIDATETRPLTTQFLDTFTR